MQTQTLLIRPNDAARLLGVTSLTIRRWLKTPETHGLRTVRLGARLIGIPTEDLHAFIARRNGPVPPVKRKRSTTTQGAQS